MIRRFAAALVLVWMLGFPLFVTSLPKPDNSGAKTDAIVVLTGGPGRIERGISELTAKHARRMLVSGVDPAVKLNELAAVQRAPDALFACCVDLGKDAVDTRTNAAETAQWIKARGYRSVRLITTDWHMPRARLELRQTVGGDVRIISDAVDSAPGLLVLLTEYNKYIVRWMTTLVGY